MITHIRCDEIGMVSLILGGGRETKESKVDLSVGLILYKKCGDHVRKGEPLAILHANSREKLEEAKKRFLEAYRIEENISQCTKNTLIKSIIR